MSTSAGTLAVRDLRFRYRGGEDLFHGLDHDFTAGGITALSGASGRGKSTLLYVLGLLLTPTSGTVLIDGAPASTLLDAKRSALRAARLGFVFQDSELDPSRTIVESVMEPGLYAGGQPSALQPRALSLLDEFGLAERAHHRPGQISGGQAQRVAVCRGLANAPRVVLADEPTGNLDPDNSTLVIDALRAAAGQGRVVVIATHDPTVLDRADEVVAL